MAILRVPQDFPSVQAAAHAAAPGDTITVAASYATAENVTVTADNLLINGNSQAAVTLHLSGVGTFRLGGTLPYAIVADNTGATIHAGNAAANVITGGTANDVIFAGRGDTVKSGGGDDLISVSGKPLSLDGGAGRDVVRVTGDTSFAAGSVSNVEQFNVSDGVLAYFDALDTPVVVRSLSHAGGHVSIRGSSANDTFFDGAGADRFVGNGGADTVSYLYSAAGVTASLAAPGGNTGSATGDTYFGVENLTGSDFADTLKGNSGANVIDGGKGNDTIYSGTGDSLFGGLGDDTFIVNGAASGAPLLVDGDGPSIDSRLQGRHDALDIVGNTSFSAGSVFRNLETVNVADGLTVDLTQVSMGDFAPSIVSHSVAGGGSTIYVADESTTPLGSVFVYGGKGADTLIDREPAGGTYSSQHAWFVLQATPTMIDGGPSGSGVVSFDKSVKLSSSNMKNIGEFELSSGDLDLSGYSDQGHGVRIDAGPYYNTAPSNITGTAFNDSIYPCPYGGTVTGGHGADYIAISHAGPSIPKSVVVAEHAGDAGDASLSQTSIDSMTGFTTALDKIAIDGLGPTSSFAAATIGSASYAAAKAQATSLMANGTDVAFITGAENSWLFWNATPGHTAPNQALEFVDVRSNNAFHISDLTPTASAQLAHLG